MILQEGSGIGKWSSIESEEKGSVRDRSCGEKGGF